MFQYYFLTTYKYRFSKGLFLHKRFFENNTRLIIIRVRVKKKNGLTKYFIADGEKVFLSFASSRSTQIIIKYPLTTLSSA